MSHRFRLAVVLRLREMAEEAARVELARALTVHARAIAGVEAAERRQADELRWLSDLQRGGVAAAADLRTGWDGQAAARRLLERTREQLATATDGLFAARRKLGEASRRREVVERLRDRFVAAERREADRRETNELAEIAATGYARRAIGQRS